MANQADAEGWTRQVAEFAANTPISWTSGLKDKIYDGITDWLASTLAARQDPMAEQLLRSLGYTVLDASLQPFPCTVIGRSERVSALDAALINGYLAHALDYDDAHEDVRGHPSAVLLSALMAEAEQWASPGLALMEGYLIGMETMCQLGRLLGAAHYEQGWHTTSTAGGISVAVAVGRMRGLTTRQLQHAIGLAATQAGGLRAHFGTPVKPLHAGLAARAGVLAARMAAEGVEGAEEVLQGKQGFLHMYRHGREGEVLDTAGWGKPWRLEAPGLWFKKYPCCSASYHAIDAANTLWEQHRYAPGDIQSVKLIYPPGGDAALVIREPRNGMEGRFSAEYIAALKLTRPELSLQDFEEQPIDEAILQLIGRSHREYRSDIQVSPEAMPKGRFTIVEVTKRDGTTASARCDVPNGSPGKPLTPEEMAYKFRLAAEGTFQDTNEAFQRVRQLDELEQVADLWVGAQRLQ